MPKIWAWFFISLKVRDVMKKNKEKKNTTMIGGQALMEGVMMRGATCMAMAVRESGGEILLETSRFPAKKRWYKKVPIIRGMVAFVSSMVSGVSTLMRSAEVIAPEEETPGKVAMTIAVILGVVFAVGLFILLPSFLNSLLFDKLLKVGILLSSILEGVLRILIFVGYLFLVSRLKDIKRTFMYHGAEHRTINCYEKGLDMTVENVQSCSTRHNRCGTTFLFFVMIISILVFSFTNWLFGFIGLPSNMFIKMGLRLLLLPLVAGLSYELLKGLAALPDNWFVNILRAPGLALQRLTTYPPTDDMAEVAIKSFMAVYEMDKDASLPTIVFGEFPLKKARSENEKKLESIGAPSAEFDWILCDILKVKRNEISKVKSLDLGQYRALKGMMDRRMTGEPLDYILGYSEFFGLKIIVNNNVLIPRCDTETLAESALKEIGDKAVTVLDLCTGSGALAKVISEKTSAIVTMSDISSAALSVAALNAPNCKIVKSDLFNEIEDSFDFIICNPPYIKTKDIESLDVQVRCYEPMQALDGGEDGLDFYRRIEKEAEGHLNDGGEIFMEIGFDQAKDITEIFGDYLTESIKDLSGQTRVIKAKSKKNRTEINEHK